MPILFLGIALADGPWVRTGFLVFLVSSVWAVDNPLRGSLNRNVSRARSALAAEQSAPTDGRPIALILRSFGERHGYSDQGVSFGVFELVEPTLRQNGFVPCVIGPDLPLPPEHEVAIVVCDDEDWWANFELIAQHAAVIVAVPETTDSLMREMKALGERQLLSKVLLLMMPKSLPVDVSFTDMPWFEQAGDDDIRERRWKAVRDLWLSMCHQPLPEWQELGALIEIGVQGEVLSVTPLRNDAMEGQRTPYMNSLDTETYKRNYGVEFVRVLRDVLARRQFAGSALRDVWPMLARRPLDIGLWSYWRPPGDNGQLRRNLGLMMAVGWTPFIFVGGLVLWHVAGDLLGSLRGRLG